MADVQMSIPLSAIRENPVALREVNTQDHQFIEMVDSIKNFGILNPISVREIPNQDGHKLFSVIDGLHRYTAATLAGLTEIPAIVKNLDDVKVMKAQIVGNIQKIDTKPAAYSKQLYKLIQLDPMMTSAQLASSLSKSTTWLHQRLKLVNLTKEIAEMVDDGQINLSNAYDLALLPPEEQANYVDRAMTMSPAEFGPTVKARKKEIDAAKRAGKAPKAAEFQPVPHHRKTSELRSEMERPVIGPILVRENNLTTPEDGFLMGVRWALQMDPRSVEAARAEDEQRKRQNELKKQEAAVERAKKRAEEVAAAAARAQEAVAGTGVAV